MDNKENLKEVLSSVMDKNKEQMNAFQAKTFVELKMNKDDIMDELIKVSDSVDNIQKNVDSVETKLAKSKIENSAKLSGSILNSINTADYKTMVDNKRNGGGMDFTFEVPLLKNAQLISDPDGSFVAGNAPVVLPFRELGVTKDPVRTTTVADLIQWGTTDSNLVDWIEVSGKTNSAATRAEGGTMAQGDISYIEYSTKVKIMSEYMKVTNESLKDASFLASEINSELLSDLNLLVDAQLLSGNNSGSNLKGIEEYADTWTGGTFQSTVTTPNLADVLRVGINQIYVSGNGKWIPNAILMHPTDVATLDLLKDTGGTYISIPFYNPESQQVVNIPIYQNVGISQGEFMIGDFQKAKGFIRDSLVVRIFDQNEADAINNRSTITANVRLAFRIKTREANAFVKGVFATGIASLTA